MNRIKTTIGELCLVGDGTHGKVKRQNSGIMYLSSKNFKANGLDLTKLDYISEEDFKKHFKEESKALTKPKKGDILMSIIGTMGMPYVVKESDKFGISSSVCIIRPSDELIPQYLYYWMLSDEFQKAVLNFKSGVAQGFLSLDTIRKLPLAYPSKKIQIKIVDIISKYDDLIENNLKRIKLLEESAELLYKEWFVNFRYPGCENQIDSSGIPKDWNNIEVEQFGDVITGKTPSTKKGEYYGGDIKFIKTPDMNDSIYVIKTNQTLTEEGAKSQEKKFVPKNSILVSCIGTVGVVSLTSELSQFNQQINALVPFEEEYVYYLYFKFKSLKETLEALGSSGATMANVNKGKFESIKILNPDKKVIKLFHDQCEVIFRQILNLQYTNEKLVEARDILIPKLITGEIEV